MPRDSIPLLFYVLSPVPEPRATFVGLRFAHVSYHSIYLDGVKTNITDEEADEIRTYLKEKEEYKEKIRKIQNG